MSASNTSTLAEAMQPALSVATSVCSPAGAASGSTPPQSKEMGSDPPVKMGVRVPLNGSVHKGVVDVRATSKGAGWETNTDKLAWHKLASVTWMA